MLLQSTCFCWGLSHALQYLVASAYLQVLLRLQKFESQHLMTKDLQLRQPLPELCTYQGLASAPGPQFRYIGTILMYTNQGQTTKSLNIVQLKFFYTATAFNLQMSVLLSLAISSAQQCQVGQANHVVSWVNQAECCHSHMMLLDQLVLGKPIFKEAVLGRQQRDFRNQHMS